MSKNKKLNQTEEAIEAAVKAAEESIDTEEEDVEEVEENEVTDVAVVPTILTDDEKAVLEKYHKKLEKKAAVKAKAKKLAKPVAFIGGGLAVVGGIAFAIVNGMSKNDNADDVTFEDYDYNNALPQNEDVQSYTASEPVTETEFDTTIE